jgi:DNA repair ATPase RecN
MSDTPETDAAQFGTGRVSVDFARRMERERAEAREKNARLREIISRANRDYDEQIELFRAEGNKLRDSLQALSQSLAETCVKLKAERDEARAELDRLGWRLTS